MFMGRRAFGGGSLLMYEGGFSEVALGDARVSGRIEISGANLRKLDASSLQVGGPLFMRSRGGSSGRFEMVNLHGATIGTDIDLRDSEFANIDLSLASIGGDLRLGNVHQKSPARVGELDLRETRVRNLMDAVDVWPQPGQLHLDGFAFGELSGRDAILPGSRWWDQNWARLDPEYSPTPYAQLATAFVKLGNPDTADEIRFLGRERAREAIYAKGLSFECIYQSVSGYGAGYGIGVYAFRVLWWVLAYAMLSVVLLYQTVPAARERGLNWCIAACLALLPHD